VKEEDEENDEDLEAQTLTFVREDGLKGRDPATPVGVMAPVSPRKRVTNWGAFDGLRELGLQGKKTFY